MTLSAALAQEEGIANADGQERHNKPKHLFKERSLDAVTKSPSPVRWMVVAAERGSIMGALMKQKKASIDRENKL